MGILILPRELSWLREKPAAIHTSKSSQTTRDVVLTPEMEGKSSASNSARERGKAVRAQSQAVGLAETRASGSLRYLSSGEDAATDKDLNQSSQPSLDLLGCHGPLLCGRQHHVLGTCTPALPQRALNTR